jgi:hypothetical protein
MSGSVRPEFPRQRAPQPPQDPLERALAEIRGGDTNPDDAMDSALADIRAREGQIRMPPVVVSQPAAPPNPDITAALQPERLDLEEEFPTDPAVTRHRERFNQTPAQVARDPATGATVTTGRPVPIGIPESEVRRLVADPSLATRISTRLQLLREPSGTFQYTPDPPDFADLLLDTFMTQLGTGIPGIAGAADPVTEARMMEYAQGGGTFEKWQADLLGAIAAGGAAIGTYATGRAMGGMQRPGASGAENTAARLGIPTATPAMRAGALKAVEDLAREAQVHPSLIAKLTDKARRALEARAGQAGDLAATAAGQGVAGAASGAIDAAAAGERDPVAIARAAATTGATFAALGSGLHALSLEAQFAKGYQAARQRLERNAAFRDAAERQSPARWPDSRATGELGPGAEPGRPARPAPPPRPRDPNQPWTPAARSRDPLEQMEIPTNIRRGQPAPEPARPAPGAPAGGRSEAPAAQPPLHPVDEAYFREVDARTDLTPYERQTLKDRYLAATRQREQELEAEMRAAGMTPQQPPGTIDHAQGSPTPEPPAGADQPGGVRPAAVPPEGAPGQAPAAGAAPAKPAPRPLRDRPAVTGWEGKPGQIFLSDGRTLKTRYMVVDASQLQASHHPDTFDPNPDYPAEIQGRAYHGKRGKAARDQVKTQAGKLRPEVLLDAGSGLTDGPPLITPQGIVVAGNQRAMMLQRASARAAGRAGKGYAAYREQLEQLREQFGIGIQPGEIAKMASPVLVRVLEDDSFDATDVAKLAELNRISDTAPTKRKDVVSAAASRAGALQRATAALRHLDETLQPDQTIRDYLGTGDGRALVRELVAEGVIGQQELPDFVDAATNAVHATGRQQLEEMFVAAAIGDADVVATAPPAALKKLGPAIPAIIRANASGPYALQQHLQKALGYLTSAQAMPGTGEKSVRAWLAQQDAFGDAIDPIAADLARFIESRKPTEVAAALRSYATLASEAAKAADGSDMFGYEPPNPADLQRRMLSGDDRVAEPEAEYLTADGQSAIDLYRAEMAKRGLVMEKKAPRPRPVMRVDEPGIDGDRGRREGTTEYLPDRGPQRGHQLELLDEYPEGYLTPEAQRRRLQGTQAVDADGKPLVLYYATTSPVDDPRLNPERLDYNAPDRHRDPLQPQAPDPALKAWSYESAREAMLASGTWTEGALARRERSMALPDRKSEVGPDGRRERRPAVTGLEALREILRIEAHRQERFPSGTSYHDEAWWARFEGLVTPPKNLPGRFGIHVFPWRRVPDTTQYASEPPLQFHSVHVNIRKPLRLPDGGPTAWTPAALRQAIEASGAIAPAQLARFLRTAGTAQRYRKALVGHAALQAFLEKRGNGYDGFVYRSHADWQGQDIWVAFRSHQVEPVLTRAAVREDLFGYGDDAPAGGDREGSLFDEEGINPKLPQREGLMRARVERLDMEIKATERELLRQREARHMDKIVPLERQLKKARAERAQLLKVLNRGQAIGREEITGGDEGVAGSGDEGQGSLFERPREIYALPTWPNVARALESIDSLGFGTNLGALHAIWEHPDWRSRWDAAQPEHDAAAQLIEQFIERHMPPRPTRREVEDYEAQQRRQSFRLLEEPAPLDLEGLSATIDGKTVPASELPREVGHAATSAQAAAVARMTQAIKTVGLPQAGRRRIEIEAATKRGMVQVVGRQLHTVYDVAELMAVYRSPVMEMLHAFLVDGQGKIVDHIAHTSGLLNSVTAPGGDADSWAAAVARRARKAGGAVNVVIGHNHPSGDPTPSGDDLSMTRRMAEHLRKDWGLELTGHVVINHDTASWITLPDDPDGSDPLPVETVRYNPKPAPWRTAAEMQAPQYRSPQSVAELSTAIVAKDAVAIVHLDAQNRVTAVEPRPAGLQLGPWLLESAERLASARLMLVTHKDQVEEIGDQVENGLARNSAWAQPILDVVGVVPFDETWKPGTIGEVRVDYQSYAQLGKLKKSKADYTAIGYKTSSQTIELEVPGDSPSAQLERANADRRERDTARATRRLPKAQRVARQLTDEDRRALDEVQREITARVDAQLEAWQAQGIDKSRDAAVGRLALEDASFRALMNRAAAIRFGSSDRVRESDPKAHELTPAAIDERLAKLRASMPVERGILDAPTQIDINLRLELYDEITGDLTAEEWWKAASLEERRRFLHKGGGSPSYIDEFGQDTDPPLSRSQKDHLLEQQVTAFSGWRSFVWRNVMSPSYRVSEDLADYDEGMLRPPDPLREDVLFEAPGTIGNRMHGELVTPPGGEKGAQDLPAIIEKLAAITELIGKTVPIRTGHVRSRNANGWFNPHTMVIRVKQANNVPTATHEVAHAIDWLLHGAPKGGPWKKPLVTPAIEKELVALGRALYGSTKPAAGYKREGWAEFLRTWMTETDLQGKPAAVAGIAPELTRWFEQQFSQQHPAVRKGLDEAKVMVTKWRMQGSRARVQATIVDPGDLSHRVQDAAAAVKRTVSMEKLVEMAQPLYDLARAAEKELGRTLKPTEDPYATMEVLRTTHDARTRYMVETAMIDLAGNPVGPALAEIRELVKGQRVEFMLYLYARRAVKLLTDKKGPRQPGISLADARQVIAELETPAFQLAAEKVYAWTAGTLDYAAQASPTFAEVVAAIRQRDPGDYMPLQREFEELDDIWEKTAGSGGATHRSPTKRLKGSGRRIKDPFPVLIGQTSKLLRQAHSRMVLDNVIRLSGVKGLGYVIEEIPKDQVPAAHATLDEIIRRANKELQLKGTDRLLQLGTDDQQGDQGPAIDRLLETTLTFFAPAQRPNGKDPIIPLYDRGRVRWFQVDGKLYDTLSSLDVYRLPDVAGIPVLEWIAGKPAALFRAGTTGLRASFGLIWNPLRDVQTFYVNTRSRRLAPVLAKEYLHALIEMAMSRGTGKHSEWVDAWIRLGGEMAQPLGQDIPHTRRAARRLFQGRTIRYMDPRNWFDWYRDFIQFPEGAPRVAELRLVAQEIGWQPGTPMTLEQSFELLRASKQVTVDFSAAGEFGRVMNRVAPFHNSAIQGPRATLRAARRNPQLFAWRGLQFVAMTLLLWWRYKDEPWYREMDYRERFLHWHFPIDIDGREELIRIPRSFEIGMFFSALPEMIFDAWYHQEPEQVAEWFRTLDDVARPNIEPVLLKAAREQWQNKQWPDRPIVPQALENKRDKEQFTEFTSRAAIEIGQVFDVSPARIDHLIRAVGGPVSGDLIEVLGYGPKGVDRQGEPSDLPIVGRIFQRGGAVGIQPRVVREMYDLVEEMQKVANSDIETEARAARRMRLQLEDAANAVSALLNVRRYTPLTRDRDHLTQQARAIAADAIEAFEKTEFNRGRFRRAEARAVRDRRRMEQARHREQRRPPP